MLYRRSLCEGGVSLFFRFGSPAREESLHGRKDPLFRAEKKPEEIRQFYVYRIIRGHIATFPSNIRLTADLPFCPYPGERRSVPSVCCNGSASLSAAQWRRSSYPFFIVSHPDRKIKCVFAGQTHTDGTVSDHADIGQDHPDIGEDSPNRHIDQRIQQTELFHMPVPGIRGIVADRDLFPGESGRRESFQGLRPAVDGIRKIDGPCRPAISASSLSGGGGDPLRFGRPPFPL